GITPLRAMFASLRGDVTLIYRASSEAELVFRDELDAIAQDRKLTVHYMIGTRAQLGGDPLTADVLRWLVPGVHRMDVYLCGPTGMAETAKIALAGAGVPRRRI